MKVAISSSGKDLGDLLDRRFGRCDFFQIFDTKTKQYTVIENQGVSAEGGAGIAAASQVIEEKVSVVITGNLGQNAFELLKKAQVSSFRCEELPVQQVVERFQEKKLAKIDFATGGHHGLH
ncbi:MAG: hypothetical protein PWP24_1479 [Clostridiales bacterium]|nr:hypothetical protein [Clostridiales bacterium]